MRLWIALALVLIGAPFVSAALGDFEFISPKGYSLKIPAGWEIVDQKMREMIERQASSAVQRAGAAGSVTYDLFVMETSTSPLTGFSPRATINVVVMPEEIPLSDEAEVTRQLQQIVKQLGVATGAQISDIQAGVEKVGQNSAGVCRYRLNGPRGSLRQIQMFIPGKRQTFIFTCAGPAAQWAKYDPIFKGVLESVAVKRSFLSDLPPWALYGIIGGLAGGSIGLVGAIIKKMKRTTAAR